jgi:hypothetical protein
MRTLTLALASIALVTSAYSVGMASADDVPPSPIRSSHR